jgi:Domain of unknown function (DUF4261)
VGVYAAELFFERRPTLTRAAFVEAVRRFSPTAELLGGDSTEGPLAVLHDEYPVTYSDGPVLPARIVFILSKEAPTLDKYDSALQQAWDFPDARATVSRATSCGLLTDLMGGPLSPADRLSVFQRTLDGLLTLVQPLAIHWEASDRLIEPRQYAAREPRKYPDPQAGAINVRLVRIENASGDTGDIVMDSRGLDVFGLPDVQCHFRGLEAGRIAGLIYGVAAYLFEKGDVIEDGHTVEGLDGQKWRCQHEAALVGPDRVVLDIDPGPPHAPGNRA